MNALRALVDAWRSIRGHEPEQADEPPDLMLEHVGDVELVTPHFAWRELACKDGSQVPSDHRPNAVALCAELEVLRAELGRPIYITSGYRTPEHNRRVGGARSSFHLTARAADIVVAGFLPGEVYATIERLIREGRMHEGGLGLYRGWVHLDTRGKRARWTG